MTLNSRWMIYGANGFTGRLIAQEARRRGLTPVLAGRSDEPVRDLAATLELESRVFTLKNPSEVHRNLEDLDLVLHCAGPFSRTFSPMLESCLASRTHYLDITGEYQVLEALQRQGPRARQAGITAVSGVGFDVVPTDSVAAHLVHGLPSATRLRLAFRGGTISRGTALTMLEGAPEGGRSRQGGLLVREPVGVRTWRVEHDQVRYVAVSIPWGTWPRLTTPRVFPRSRPTWRFLPPGRS
ncbi:saccharopine dehydrogenase family protein [Deinococcus malanensis]|uniref:saccharopine dehydrogenase family protein n=1 Tax=Deinococcus malanensis TaxID=1706855 RepID=UPI0036395997